MPLSLNAYTASVCQGDGNERRKGNRDSRTARFEDWRAVWKIEEAIDAMHYRRMVGNDANPWVAVYQWGQIEVNRWATSTR